MAQSGHHGNGHVGEHDSFAADPHAPADGAGVAGLRLIGDPHPLGAGVLAEARRTAGAAGVGALTLSAFGLRKPADDGDLFPVDPDLGVLGEPGVGQPTGEPVDCVGGVGLVGLLPAAGAAEPPPVSMVWSHDYMLTPLHRWGDSVR